MKVCSLSTKPLGLYVPILAYSIPFHTPSLSTTNHALPAHRSLLTANAHALSSQSLTTDP